MKYIATIGERQIEVELTSDQQLIVNGEQMQVDFQSVANQPIFSLLLNGKSHEASIFPSDTGYQVLFLGQLFNVVVEDERQRRLRTSSGGPTVHGGEIQLRAPMPGMVVDVPVEEGQQVAAGENLIILESMKMQNELKSPREGVVSRVRVKAGDNVDQNQVMITLS
ncbi:MAG: biotin/lipoyl-binding protein [Anaerolineales bacterium]|jgi:biotin carboxyl carrier protein